MSHILADENVHIDIVHALRASGHIVVTVSELGLVGTDDDILLKVANRRNMILLTADKDFGGILEMGPLWGKGRVLLLRYRLINLGRIIRELTAVLTEIEKTFSNTPGLIVVLSEGRYRLHRPPLRMR